MWLRAGRAHGVNGSAVFRAVKRAFLQAVAKAGSVLTAKNLVYSL